jgi:Matrixin
VNATHHTRAGGGSTAKAILCALIVLSGSFAVVNQADAVRRVAVAPKAKPKTGSKVAAKPATVPSKTSSRDGVTTRSSLPALRPGPTNAIPSSTASSPSTTASLPTTSLVPTVSLLPVLAPSVTAPVASVPVASVPVASVPVSVTPVVTQLGTSSPAASPATSAPASTATTTVKPVSANGSPIPTPVIAGIDVTDKTTTLRLEPASPILYAHIRFSGAGFERFATEILGTAGQTTFSLGRAPDPNTQYTLRISWDSGPAPTAEELVTAKPAIGGAALLTTRSATAGPEIVKVLAPRFPQPLNRSPGLVAGQGWTSLLTSSLETTRRNPCVPWRIVYDDRNAPLDFQERLKSSIAQVAEATGVPIEYGGIERVDSVSDPQKLRVAWDTSATATLGLARQSYVRDGGGTVWRTTGTITMAAKRKGITADRWHAVVLHELGHIFGLDHTNQPTSVMYSPVESGENWPYSALFFTETDRAGLFAMNGKETGGSCLTVLEDPLNP